jgi:hypothetical protein
MKPADQFIPSDEEPAIKRMELNGSENIKG